MYIYKAINTMVSHSTHPYTHTMKFTLVKYFDFTERQKANEEQRLIGQGASGGGHFE